VGIKQRTINLFQIILGMAVKLNRGLIISPVSIVVKKSQEKNQKSKGGFATIFVMVCGEAKIVWDKKHHHIKMEGVRIVY